MVKNLLAETRDLGSIPGLERSPGEGNCNPLQYSCLENPMDRGAWRATAHRVAKSQTQMKPFSPINTITRHSLCCCCCEVTSGMSDSVQPHRRQPTGLIHPWDSPGENTGVCCHFLLQCMKVKRKSLSRVQLLVTPWTAANQAPPSMGFSRQEYWNEVP